MWFFIFTYEKWPSFCRCQIFLCFDFSFFHFQRILHLHERKSPIMSFRSDKSYQCSILSSIVITSFQKISYKVSLHCASVLKWCVGSKLDFEYGNSFTRWVFVNTFYHVRTYRISKCLPNISLSDLIINYLIRCREYISNESVKINWIISIFQTVLDNPFRFILLHNKLLE